MCVLLLLQCHVKAYLSLIAHCTVTLIEPYVVKKTVWLFDRAIPLLSIYDFGSSVHDAEADDLILTKS